jgi:hypothetical protein
VIITSTPDLAALRNTKNMFDFLTAARPNDKAPLVVLNQVGVQKRPEIPVSEFAKAIGTEPAAVIPFDAHIFGTAASNGQMICDIAPKSQTGGADSWRWRPCCWQTAVSLKTSPGGLRTCETAADVEEEVSDVW